LNRTQTALKHPLLPAVILAEMQLERHAKIYRQYYIRYTAIFYDIKSESEKMQVKSASSDTFDGLEIAGWLTRIFSMYQKHRNFLRLLASFCRILATLIKMSDQLPGTPESLNVTDRLREILDHYEDLVEQSRITADGTSLLLTTVSLPTAAR